MNINKITLELFNGVLIGKNQSKKAKGFKSTQKKLIKMGIFINDDFVHAANDIHSYFKNNALKAKALNKTFYADFATVINSTEEELQYHQILHYLTTYGGEGDIVYVPNEQLNLPSDNKKGMPLKQLKLFTADSLLEEISDLINSGIALKSDTIEKLVSLIKELYTGDKYSNRFKSIKNKEIVPHLLEMGFYIDLNATELFRYIFFKATGQTLLIKNKTTIDLIKSTDFNMDIPLIVGNVDLLAQVFNRFKPLFLAFKSNGVAVNKSIVNRISKQSKQLHKPMPFDYLNSVTAQHKIKREELKSALDKCNSFRKVRLFYLLSELVYKETYGITDAIFKIRNGKTFKVSDKTYNLKGKQLLKALEEVRSLIVNDLKAVVDGKMILYPTNVDYAMPTSEKNFIGNFTYGTKINTNDGMCVGIYWENSWGARDLDLTSTNLNGAVGWFTGKTNYNNSIVHTGDMTDATNGATEYVYMNTDLIQPTMVFNNVYSHDAIDEPKFKLIVGNKAKKKMTKNYVINPKDVIFEQEMTMERKQKMLGMMVSNEDKSLSFVLLDNNLGNGCVTSSNNQSLNNALFYKWNNCEKLSTLLKEAGATLIHSNEFLEEEEYIDLSVNQLDKTSLINLFKK